MRVDSAMRPREFTDWRALESRRKVIFITAGDPVGSYHHSGSAVIARWIYGGATRGMPQSGLGGGTLTEAARSGRGQLRVKAEECKGCGLCVEACPPKVIALSEGMNHYGYRTAIYAGAGCTGCGVCFMVCPEPGAITVLRAVRRPMVAVLTTDSSNGEVKARA